MNAPWLDDGDLALYHGDAAAVLRSLPAGIAQTCVTSPPYWGLRSYLPDAHDDKAAELGLEATPDAYVERLVLVMREVWRVLRADGTLWLTLGDSYFGGGQDGGQFGSKKEKVKWAGKGNREVVRRGDPHPDHGLKFKDLCGIPWRVAFALQRPWYTCEACGTESHSDQWARIPDDFGDGGGFSCPACSYAGPVASVAPGWYLRSDIIWAKPNPMPESVTDRPTKAHEYVFLLAKQPRYYYDADAIREPATADEHMLRYHTGGAYPDRHGEQVPGSGAHRGIRQRDPESLNGGRNARSVWEIATQPTPEAHFATYPEALVRRCILAGTSAHGGCAKCGAPWQRLTGERIEGTSDGRRAPSPGDGEAHRIADPNSGQVRLRGAMTVERETTGWAASCACGAPPVAQTVLDPFIGSGTTALVARKHGRRAIGIDLSESYLQIAAKRTSQLSLLGEGAA